jgi:CopG family nickel-responsive transcriptional regulator
VALDHETSIEMAVLRGETKEVERLADRIIAERGVRRGQVVVFPASIASERHSHGERRPRKHEHIKVC